MNDNLQKLLNEKIDIQQRIIDGQKEIIDFLKSKIEELLK
jgi:hypothetical protein